MIKKLKIWLGLWTVLSMFACLPIFSGWLKNRAQVSVFDLFLPLGLSFFTALIFSLIFYKVYIKNRFIGLVGGILALLIIDKVQISFISSRLIFASLTVGLMLVLTWLISKWITPKWPLNLTNTLFKAVIITVLVAFLLQFGPVIKALIIEWPQFFYRPPEFSFGELTTPKDKPDIYYLIFDRYANQNVLKDQFNFDNKQFINWLKEKGFFVIPNAFSNYPYTTMSVSSTLLGNYHDELVEKFGQVSLQTQIPYHRAIMYSPVIKTLKKFGYSYYHFGSWYEATNNAPLADYHFQQQGVITIFGHIFVLNSFSKNILLNSFYGELARRLFIVMDLNEGEATLYKLKELNKLVTQKSGGRFIFVHILSPHEPYYFNPDGSFANPDDERIPTKQKYVNQVQFINNQIKKLVLKIQEKSKGKAIIIIQSDEGPYPMFINSHPNPTEEIWHSDMRKWSDADLKMKYSILAAYYIPQAKEKDLKQGADNVNVFRLIFNTYFGGKLSYLPRCYYGYPSGRTKSFVYTDITKRLLGEKTYEE